jgi:PLP dependent protein
MMSASIPATDLGGRLADVWERIAAAARRAGRQPSAVTLVAVSKGFGAREVREAKDRGQLDFGENRVQELMAKAAAVPGVRWHFIGRLQRNKVRDVVGTATLVHSMDRPELADALAQRASSMGRLQRVLVQVNAADDPAKAGCSVADTPQLLAHVRALEGLACEGLMTMPAADADPRPAFARLRGLRDRLQQDFPEVRHLSMGMTHDFEVAIEEGATIVRLGEAVFGPRPDPAGQPATPVDPASSPR